MAESRRWTCADDRKIREALDSPCSVHIPKLATQLGRSHGAIQSRIQKHEFSKMLEERCNEQL